jgi:hypothetical protein
LIYKLQDRESAVEWLSCDGNDAATLLYYIRWPHFRDCSGNTGRYRYLVHVELEIWVKVGLKYSIILFLEESGNGLSMRSARGM